jgi:hypothetical protein
MQVKAKEDKHRHHEGPQYTQEFTTRAAARHK